MGLASCRAMAKDRHVLDPVLTTLALAVAVVAGSEPVECLGELSDALGEACRHPGHGGDHQPLTACYQRHVARLDRELAALHTAVLAAIAARTGITPAARADWSAEAVAVQGLWRRLRDKACALEAYETPNRFANAIYSGIVGPCLVVETEARIRWLRSRYRPQ